MPETVSSNKIPTRLEDDWLFWSEGSISVGRVGETSTSSFKEIEHSLGRYPLACRVYVRPTGGNNKGYIFEARGFNTRDDAGYWTQYGGLIYAYSDKAFRITQQFNKLIKQRDGK